MAYLGYCNLLHSSKEMANRDPWAHHNRYTRHKCGSFQSAAVPSTLLSVPIGVPVLVLTWNPVKILKDSTYYHEN